MTWGTPATLSLTMLLSITGGFEGSVLISVFWLALCGIIGLAIYYGNPSKTCDFLRLTTAIILLLTVLGYAIKYSGFFITYAGFPVSLSITFIALIFIFLRVRNMKKTP